MAWFKKGATYRFLARALDSKGKSGTSKLRKKTMSFVRTEPGYGVTHHIFRMTGGALESFTKVQLDDYVIEKVA